MFSILIPSWNNLPYLRLCVESLRRHSAKPHQIVVHANDGADGTLEWLRQQGIEHTASERNIGICYAVNLAAGLAKGDHLLYLNDDMVAAPGWDLALEQALARVKHYGMFMLSGTMVEPVETGNACVVVKDYGREPARFDMARFAAEAPGLSRSDWLGATWPPTLVPREKQTKKRTIIAEVDWGSAFATIYPKAIYLVESDPYEVQELIAEPTWLIGRLVNGEPGHRTVHLVG